MQTNHLNFVAKRLAHSEIYPLSKWTEVAFEHRTLEEGIHNSGSPEKSDYIRTIVDKFWQGGALGSGATMMNKVGEESLKLTSTVPEFRSNQVPMRRSQKLSDRITALQNVCQCAGHVVSRQGWCATECSNTHFIAQRSVTWTTNGPIAGLIAGSAYDKQRLCVSSSNRMVSRHTKGRRACKAE
ncbi:hypothetical protein Tco_0397444 [Tanacetum coccineum]